MTQLTSQNVLLRYFFYNVIPSSLKTLNYKSLTEPYDPVQLNTGGASKYINLMDFSLANQAIWKENVFKRITVHWKVHCELGRTQKGGDVTII